MANCEWTGVKKASRIVCAAYGGMTGSMKKAGIYEGEKTKKQKDNADIWSNRSDNVFDRVRQFRCTGDAAQ